MTPPGLLIHELGHAVAGLGDEYVSTLQSQPAGSRIKEWASYHPNVSDTPDRTKLKWKDLFGKDGVGAYEGAMDRAKGLYRPWEEGCLMGDHTADRAATVLPGVRACHPPGHRQSGGGQGNGRKLIAPPRFPGRYSFRPGVELCGWRRICRARQPVISWTGARK